VAMAMANAENISNAKGTKASPCSSGASGMVRQQDQPAETAVRQLP
jgi:hypothetical protein